MSSVEIWAAAPAAAPAGPRSRARVYISSAARDLLEARAIVIDTVRRSACRLAALESYGADGRPPIERCLADVESCEVYVGIAAWRYGSCPPGQRMSFTHLGYAKAASLGKRVLLFHLDENAPWPTRADDSRQAVRRFRTAQLRAHIVDMFSDLDELATGVRRALNRLYGGVTTSVPELLSYIVDRHAQKEILAAGAHELDLSPSMIVVHRPATQVHHRFVEHMQERLLTRYLGIGLVHPISVARREEEELDRRDVVTWRIADGCGFDPTVAVDELAGQLQDSDWVTMLRFRLRVEARSPDARGVSRLTEYFAQWPWSRPLRALPVISVQYADPAGWDPACPGSAPRPRAGSIKRLRSPSGRFRTVRLSYCPR